MLVSVLSDYCGRGKNVDELPIVVGRAVVSGIRHHEYQALVANGKLARRGRRRKGVVRIEERCYEGLRGRVNHCDPRVL